MARKENYCDDFIASKLWKKNNWAIYVKRTIQIITIYLKDGKKTISSSHRSFVELFATSNFSIFCFVLTIGSYLLYIYAMSHLSLPLMALLSLWISIISNSAPIQILILYMGRSHFSFFYDLYFISQKILHIIYMVWRLSKFDHPILIYEYCWILWQIGGYFHSCTRYWVIG